MKKNEYSKSILIYLVVLIFAAGVPRTTALASMEQERNTELSAHISEEESTPRVMEVPSADGVQPGGHIPSYIDPSYYNYSEDNRPRARVALPSTYDLRSKNLSTGVKNQSPWGTCWAFGAISSVEGNALMQMNTENLEEAAGTDYAERHMAWFCYQTQRVENGKKEGIENLNDNLWDQGGNRDMAVGLLSSWAGAQTEEAAPYLNSTGKDWSLPDAQRYESAVHIQDADFLPGTALFSDEKDVAKGTGYRFDSSACDAVKRMVMERGVVDMSYYADQSRPNQTGNSKYINQNTFAQYTYEYNTPNHDVSIVGWDDNYAKNNFNAAHQPPGNGAWIVKNSWGASWGLKGYFYLSYYDQSICDFTSFSVDLPDREGRYEYDNNYQYDLLGMMSPTSLLPMKSSRPIRIANIFTAKESEMLTAVSAVTLEPGSVVDIQIYKVPDNSSPENKGVLLGSQSEVIKFGGYHTISLNEPIQLEKGDKFSVIESIKGESGYYIPLEADRAGAYSGFDKYGNWVDGVNMAYAVCEPGQSFYDKSSWADMADSPIKIKGYHAGNGMIKAFTENMLTVQVEGFDSEGMKIGSGSTIMSYGRDVKKFDLLPYTASVALSAQLGGNERVEIRADGRTFQSGEEIPRAVFEGKIVSIRVTDVNSPKITRTYECELSVPDTRLEDKLVTLTDSHSYLPQRIAFSSVIQGEKDAYFSEIKELLSSLGTGDQFLFYQIGLTDAGEDFVLKEGQTVDLEFQKPEGFAADRTRLYKVTMGEEGVVLTEIGSLLSGSLSLPSTDLTHGYYVTAEIKHPGPAAPQAPEVQVRTDRSITMSAVTGYEYALTESLEEPINVWQMEREFHHLKPNTQYYIFARIAQTDAVLAGQISDPTAVMTKSEGLGAPQVPELIDRTDTRIRVMAVEGQEYALKVKESQEYSQWQERGDFIGLMPGTAYDVVTRVKATEDVMESSPSAVLQVSTKLSPLPVPAAPEVVSATDNSITVLAFLGQEYSIDNGTNWQRSGIFGGLLPNTAYVLITRIYETDESMPSSNSDSVTGVTQQVGMGPSTPILKVRTDTRIAVIAVDDQEYTIKEQGAQSYQNWQDEGEFVNLNPGTSYEIATRLKAGQNTEPGSESIPFVIKTRYSAPETPKIPEILVRTDRKITVKVLPGQAYSIENTNEWKESGSFDGLMPDSDYTIITKIIQTDDQMESLPSNGVTARTKRQAPSIPQMPLLESKTDSSISVKGVSGQEYSIDGGVRWQKDSRFAGLKDNTPYGIITRIPETEEAMGTGASQPLQVYTNLKPVIQVRLQVFFDGNGGSVAPASYHMIYGTPYGTLPLPKRTGYIFQGWYTGKTGGSKITSSSQSSYPSNHTLFARWKGKEYKISFQVNGGKGNIKSKKVVYGSTYGGLTNPKRQGYEFKGWYTAKKGGKKVTSRSKVSLTKNQTFWARWKKVSVDRVSSVKLTNPSSKILSIKIKGVKGADGYQIDYALNSAMTKSKKKVVSSDTKKSLTKLKKGSTYYVKVRAYQKDSAGKKIYGGYSSVGKLKLKK